MSTPAYSARPIPESDVSTGVGLAGLFGLFTWLLIARNWPEIAPLFGFPSDAGRLNGPIASLMCVVSCAVPMVVWSLAVDKVHLRPSTGLDWSLRRSLRDTFDISVTKIAGLWATFAIIGFIYCLERWYWRGTWYFAMEVLMAIAIPLFLLAIPYVLWIDRHLKNPRDASWHFGAMLIGREPYAIEEVWIHLRAWAVKGFFCAFMISILPWGYAEVVAVDLATLPRNPFAITTTLISVLFLIDVQLAMVGYVLTLKPLDAQIRSANPHLAGWVAALICYPPFIQMGGTGVLDYHPGSADWGLWLQGHEALAWVWGAILVFLTGIYAWATAIYGIRFSNLTYRGVITNGPYRFTRHPAYLGKNLFWWFSTMPFLATTGSFVDSVRNTCLMALVSAVYYWRAKTEEKHLLAEDPKYREYHAWMAQNAPITRGLTKLGRLFRPRGPRLQPAE
jgi:protein-S-isoprenylcysteine O-methyltransferase Ste14